MKKLKENLNYIISEKDTDKIKLEKLLQKLNESNIELFSKNIIINSTDNNVIVSSLEFVLKTEETEETISYPYVATTETFNKNIFENIILAKKTIIFERLGIQPKFIQESVPGVGTITPKQKDLILDKQKNDKEKIIDNKLAEFGISSIDELSKNQASKIIDCFPRGRA